jgi:opacity protein-like surface antigen
MRRTWSVARWSPVVLVLVALGLFIRPAQAEWYVAGQLGANVPGDLSNVQWSPGGAGNDLKLQTSVVYGGKVGYYFESIKWLGVETELFNAHPHIKQQDLTIGGIPANPIPGTVTRVLTWAPVNLILRYQAGAFEPYGGVGLGVFFSHVNDTSSLSLGSPGFSGDSTNVGLNTQVGLRYRVTKSIATFAEWKYNWAQITQDNLAGRKVQADYSANNFVVGLGYHF